MADVQTESDVAERIDPIVSDRHRAVLPSSEEGQAFQVAMESLCQRLFGSSLTMPVHFLLTDLDSLSIRQDSWLNEPVIAISKGLIAATPDENTLAALVAYHMLANDLVPEKVAKPVNSLNPDKLESLHIALQVVDYLQEAGYSEDGLTRAFELLSDANERHPLHQFDTIVAPDMADQWRQFALSMGLAQRTRLQGWRDAPTSSSHLQGFDRSGNYDTFKLDVALSSRTSLVENWLYEHGYHDTTSPEIKTRIFLAALHMLPEEASAPYVTLWSDLFQYASLLHKELDEAELPDLASKLQTQFLQAVHYYGMSELTGFLVDQQSPGTFIQSILHSGTAIQDSFGFILPVETLIDYYLARQPQKTDQKTLPISDIAATRHGADIRHTLQWEFDPAMQTEAAEKLQKQLAQHRWRKFPQLLGINLLDAEETLTLEERLTGLAALIRKNDDNLTLYQRLQQEHAILKDLKDLASDDPVQAGRMAHYFLTQCHVLDPLVFHSTKELWVNILPELLGTEAVPTASSDHFTGQTVAITLEILSTCSLPNAHSLLAELANVTELQPDFAFAMEKQIAQAQVSGATRYSMFIGGAEWLGEMLLQQHAARELLLSALLSDDPAKIITRLETLFNLITETGGLAAHHHDELMELRDKTVGIFNGLASLLDRNESPLLATLLRSQASQFDKICTELLNALEDPEKIDAIKKLGFDFYIYQTSEGAVDRETLESTLQLAHSVFWNSAVEVRGLVTTALLFGDGRTPDSPMIGIQGLHYDSIKHYVLDQVIPDTIPKDLRWQIETFVNDYTAHTTEYDRMAIFGYAMALKPPGAGTDPGKDQGEAQGEILMQFLSSFGALGVKFAQGLEGMPTLSDSVRSGMAKSKERDIDLTRWDYFHKIFDKVPETEREKIEHYGSALAAGSNQFTGAVTYEGEECALTCLHDAVRERASFEATVLGQALQSIVDAAETRGADTTRFEIAHGLLERAYAAMRIEHDYNIGKWQVETAQSMYNNLTVTVEGMPVHFKVVDWKAHGQEFKLESMAQGISYKKLVKDGTIDNDSIRKLSIGIETAESMWMISGQIFDSDRHGANEKIKPVTDLAGNITAWEVNIFDVGALLTQRPSREMRIALGKAIGEAFVAMQHSNSTFTDAMQHTLLDHARQAKAAGKKEVADYLFEVPRAVLAQQDYYTPFSDEECVLIGKRIIQTMLFSGRVDTAIAQGIMMSAGGAVMGDLAQQAKQSWQQLVKAPRAFLGQMTQSSGIEIHGGRGLQMQSLPK